MNANDEHALGGEELDCLDLRSKIPEQLPAPEKSGVENGNHKRPGHMAAAIVGHVDRGDHSPALIKELDEASLLQCCQNLGLLGPTTSRQGDAHATGRSDFLEDLEKLVYLLPCKSVLGCRYRNNVVPMDLFC